MDSLAAVGGAKGNSKMKILAGFLLVYLERAGQHFAVHSGSPSSVAVGTNWKACQNLEEVGDFLTADHLAAAGVG